MANGHPFLLVSCCCSGGVVVVVAVVVVVVDVDESKGLCTFLFFRICKFSIGSFLFSSTYWNEVSYLSFLIFC